MASAGGAGVAAGAGFGTGSSGGAGVAAMSAVCAGNGALTGAAGGSLASSSPPPLRLAWASRSASAGACSERSGTRMISSASKRASGAGCGAKLTPRMIIAWTMTARQMARPRRSSVVTRAAGASPAVALVMAPCTPGCGPRSG